MKIKVPLLLSLLWLAAQSPRISLLAASAHANPLPLPSAPATSYSVADVGPHHRTWVKTSWETNAQGVAVTRTSSYEELADGLHYQKDGRWHESREIIEIQTEGAMALQGQHRVYFPGDIYNGTFELRTPDDQLLVIRPVGLSFSDGEKNVLIAELKDGSQGQLLPNSNQVLYADICSGCKMDLLCTYKRSSYESDLIIRQALPDPGEYGFSDASKVRIQWWTEFFDPPAPVKTERVMDDGSIEEILDFGTMTMPRGKAFLLGTSAEAEFQIPVNKHWVTLDGRTFLVEEIPFSGAAQALRTLPPREANAAGQKTVRLATTSLPMPSARLPRHTTKPVTLAKADYRQGPGFIWDYLILA